MYIYYVTVEDVARRVFACSDVDVRLLYVTIDDVIRRVFACSHVTLPPVTTTHTILVHLSAISFQLFARYIRVVSWRRELARVGARAGAEVVAAVVR